MPTMTTGMLDEISPHTIKKYELMTAYIEAWAYKILGWSKSEGVVFIDCFCNCGQAILKSSREIVDATPIRVAEKLNTIMERFPTKKAYLYFNDFNETRVEHLKNLVAGKSLSNIIVDYQVGDADQFLKNFTKPKGNYNSLLFYDPYKAAIDWEAIEPFLNTWGEVIINHMVYEADRNIPRNLKPHTTRKYENTYQRDIEQLQKAKNRDELDKIIRDIIINRSASEIYLAAAPIYNRNNALIYNLIHCTHRDKGFQLFKRKVWDCFGGQSSSINPRVSVQLSLDAFAGPSGNEESKTYDVYDIAEYVYHKFKHHGTVPKKDIKAVLAAHPIFPSDGYLLEMYRALKEMYKVEEGKSNITFLGDSE